MGVFMGYETLILEKTGHVAILTLNRPEKLNAFDRQLSREFHAALDEVEGEFPDVRALVLTGAGRGFCSGADVSILAEDRPPGQSSRQQDNKAGAASSVIALAPRLPRLPQPVIAAVNGVAGRRRVGNSPGQRHKGRLRPSPVLLHFHQAGDGPRQLRLFLASFAGWVGGCRRDGPHRPNLRRAAGRADGPGQQGGSRRAADGGGPRRWPRRLPRTRLWRYAPPSNY